MGILNREMAHKLESTVIMMLTTKLFINTTPGLGEVKNVKSQMDAGQTDTG